VTSSPNLLLDTNILIHLIRDNQVGRSIESRFRLRNRPVRPLISIVTVGELLAVARKRGWGPGKVQALEDLLDTAALVDIHSRPILEAYAEIDFFLERSGWPIGQNDVWIAATAVVSGAHLLTMDKDFDPLCPAYLDRTWIDPQRPDA
jgi:tRNA(fMet)-specific endonuclease VapC